MKIKFSFITNSSSSVYIVFIPNDFSPGRYYIANLLEKELNEFPDEDTKHLLEKDKDEIIEYIADDIEDIKEGEQFCYNEYTAPEVSEWRVILKICEDNNFILATVELPMNESDAIIGLTQENIIKTLTSHIDLDKFMKPFIRNEEDKKL